MFYRDERVLNIDFLKISSWLKEYKDNSVLVINGKYESIALIEDCEYVFSWAQAYNSDEKYPKDIRLYPLTKRQLEVLKMEFEDPLVGIRVTLTKSEKSKLSPIISNY